MIREAVDAIVNQGRSLSEEGRTRATILAGNYGEAGTINFFGGEAADL